MLYANRNEYKPGEKAIILLVYDPSKDDGQSPKWQMTSKKLESGESGLLTNENDFKEETAEMTEGKSSKYVEVTSDEPALVSVSCTYKGTKYSFELTFKEDAKSNTTNSDKKGNEVPMLPSINE